MFLQIAKDFSPNLQDISPISEQLTFFSVLFRDDLVSDPSLHVPRALRSALWVVGCGSLVTPVFSYMCTGSALDVMDYGLSKAESAA